MYIDSLTWIKDKKTIINPINKNNNKCFQYVVKVALNYEKVKKDPQRITKIIALIDKYNLEGIHYPSEKDDWIKFEKNYWLLLMFCILKKKNISCLCFKTQFKLPKQIIILMILNGEGWHYLVVKNYQRY